MITIILDLVATAVMAITLANIILLHRRVDRLEKQWQRPQVFRDNNGRRIQERK